MAEEDRTGPPLVYSCSGCSNVAQLANDIALEIARRGLAQMSCIAGVGGDVPSLVRVARSGRFILGLDGCRLHCVKNCLARHGVALDEHVTMTEQGIRKREGERCSDALRDELAHRIAQLLEEVAPS
jgi:uncharacterized metal-binding protein